MVCGPTARISLQKTNVIFWILFLVVFLAIEEIVDETLDEKKVIRWRSSVGKLLIIALGQDMLSNDWR
jgi:hypothetical protein